MEKQQQLNKVFNSQFQNVPFLARLDDLEQHQTLMVTDFIGMLYLLIRRLYRCFEK